MIFDVRRGKMSRVALVGDNSIEYINILLDIWNAGDCAVLIDWRIPFQMAFDMMHEAGVNKCYIEQKAFDKIDVNAFPLLRFEVYRNDTIFSKELPIALYGKYHESYDNDEAVIVYSSGTTGKSKGVILSHYAISTNADSIMDYMKLTPTDCVYMIKTISHLSSITGELLVALKNKNKLIIGPTIVPPRVMLNNIQRFGVTSICVNPAILRFIVEEYERKNYDVTLLRDIYVHGAKTDEKLGKKAKKMFTNCNIYYEYGLTEAGPRVSSQKVNESHNLSVGIPISGVELAIINEDGTPVLDGMRGTIHVNTPSRCSGYVVGEEKHKSLYKGWLNTGDIGLIDENKELHIIDRVDDMIVIDAHKVYPMDIERLILEDDQILDCSVSKCTYDGSELIGCLYVSDVECTIDIIHRLKKSLMQYEIPKRFVKSAYIPHNQHGKVDKKEVAQILSNNNIRGI